MDYRGQVLNEYVYQAIYAILSIVAFFAGWAYESYDVTFMVWAASLLVGMAVCVPDWPWFNKHPVAWVGKQSTAQRGLSPEEFQSAGDEKEDAKARARNAVSAQQRRKK